MHVYGMVNSVGNTKEEVMASPLKELVMLQVNVKNTQEITKEHTQGNILIMHDSADHTIIFKEISENFK